MGAGQGVRACSGASVSSDSGVSTPAIMGIMKRMAAAGFSSPSVAFCSRICDSVHRSPARVRNRVFVLCE